MPTCDSESTDTSPIFEYELSTEKGPASNPFGYPASASSLRALPGSKTACGGCQ
jgi:hypothetical protein